MNIDVGVQGERAAFYLAGGMKTLITNMAQKQFLGRRIVRRVLCDSSVQPRFSAHWGSCFPFSRAFSRLP